MLLDLLIHVKSDQRGSSQTQRIIVTFYFEKSKSIKFLKAGPRKDIFFNTDNVKAAIVTCGGLCPGLNVVVREIVMSLWYNYEVRHIYGIKWGYKGFYTDTEHSWVSLSP